jgi:hypothetical protein
MKFLIEIEGASPEFERDILAVFSKHREIISTGIKANSAWTLRRAIHFMKIANPGTRSLVNDVVERGGWIDADELRAMGRDLRSSSLSMTRTVQRGIREGSWPNGMMPPIIRVYESSQNSGRKARGCSMDRELVSTFRQIPD